LGVEYLLEGSVRRWGERVRISAQLISVHGQSNVWSQSYDREVADIFLIQTEVARRIAESIVEELNASTAAKPKASTTSKDAYEAYLCGRNHWNQRTEESLLKAVHYFGQAIRSDPKLAVAHCGLGEAYNLLAFYGMLPPREAMPLAKAAALRALEINHDLGEAHACLADASCFYDWDWDTAAYEYQKALELNPSYATAHHFFASFLAAVGQYTRALAEIELASAYDPHSTIIPVWKSIILRLAGMAADAIEVSFELIKRDPQYVLARWALGLAYEAAGDLELALAEFKTAATLSGCSPVMLASLAYNLGIQGQAAKANEVLKQLHALSSKRYVTAYDFATAYLGLGEVKEALKYLDRAFQERCAWIVTLPIEPRMRNLRSDPFFQSLLRKLKLPSSDQAIVAAKPA